MRKGIGTISPQEVSDIHDGILKDSGGLPGVCPDKSLEAVLYRVENHILYGDINSLHEVAAMYAVSIATGHPFNDGNKRTAMVSMIVFLSINGITFNAPDHELANTMVKIADHNMGLAEVSRWVKFHSK